MKYVIKIVRTRVCLAAAVLLLVTAAPVRADVQKIAVADGKFEMEVPESWKRQRPQVNIIEYEFQVPKASDRLADGRLTMMIAGGSAQENIDRWVSQFRNVTRDEGGKAAKIKKVTVADREVQIVDISGSYLDRRGPFAPATERPDYRMLGAIIPLEGPQQYFLKLYGPRETIDKHEKAFLEVIQSLKAR